MISKEKVRELLDEMPDRFNIDDFIQIIVDESSVEPERVSRAEDSRAVYNSGKDIPNWHKDILDQRLREMKDDGKVIKETDDFFIDEVE